MVEAGGGGTLGHIVQNAPPEDHALKREYLASLPTEQVIDICLRLDVHVPMALKRNIWPADFRSALRKTPKVEDVPPSLSTTAVTTTTAAVATTTPTPPAPIAGPSSAPLQPYGYPYQHYPGYAYPYSYPPPPGVYPQPPYAYPGAPPFFTTPHAPDPTSAADDGDLPSYEDMIVEGLTAVNDPEGLAPKDLFNWMATRYPVQSNFRPSASQALQKAYRRGRFEKSTSGKYRLNPHWEGGNSSTRRATRRPQTQSAAAPLIPAPAPGGYAFPGGQPRPLQPFIPVPPRPALPAPSALGPRPPANGAAPLRWAPPSAVPPARPHVPPASEHVFAAAQSMLQGINFAAGTEGTGRGVVDPSRAELQAQLALLAAQLEEVAQEEEGDGGEDGDEEEEEDAEGETEEGAPVV
ncbi:H15 domain-containing protein [Mycena indigotica]|uniref:Histone H1 n=1 Tax=Mycena indigotica TaxID=2126181 RepID=A0A8H6SJB7_9AGAR|nr:H15 domain-containing protein [Mycena indigotica]KAF7298900.1 H15 domain-containing protein [Mycena indigotica]